MKANQIGRSLQQLLKESGVDRIRRHDNFMTEVCIRGFLREAVEILDALKHNTVVKTVRFHTEQMNQEALDKMSQVMKWLQQVSDNSGH